MPHSNGSVVTAFTEGASHGRSNNMEIREGPLSYGGTEYVHEGETALVGYGWAIYAKRTSKGRIIVYNGWRKWAQEKPGQSGHTTLQHLSMIEDAAGPTFIYKDAQAQCSSPPDSAEMMKSVRA